MTHSYLLNRDEQPKCVGCDKPFTVSHILLECVVFSNVRNKYYHVNTIKQLFNDVPIHSGKCIRRFAGIYAYCRYFIDRKW